MSALDEMRDWGARMRGRTFRQFELRGGTPAGWHVLLPAGDFGFLDVRWPRSADEHALLVQEARDYMREMGARACLFVMERELSDGRPALFLQFEACDRLGARQRSVSLHPILADGDRRWADELHELVPAREADLELTRFGLFPDLLPEPPSPLRVL